jgi:hypothetical protein
MLAAWRRAAVEPKVMDQEDYRPANGAHLAGASSTPSEIHSASKSRPARNGDNEHVAQAPDTASVLTCPIYEFIRVRSRRALVTACPYPSLLK